MELFDRLIADDSVTTVIDLGYAPFDQFFAVMGEIGFVPEARRHAIEPIVLFITDRAPATAQAYRDLRRLLPKTIFVPVHNEAVSVTFDKEDFPPSRPDCRMIRIPRLSPIVRGVIDRPSFSFGAYMLRTAGRTDRNPRLGRHHLQRISRTRAAAADGLRGRVTRQPGQGGPPVALGTISETADT